MGNTTTNPTYNFLGSGEVIIDGDALTLTEQAVDPGATANAGKVYTKDDAGTTELFYQDSGGTVRQLTPPSGALPAATEATATADTTTTSATDVLVNAMTLTPAAGTYTVFFTGSVDHSANNGDIDTSVYSGGVQVASSERTFGRGAGQGNVTSSFCCVAIVTVNGAQAIEGQWRTSGATATMHERALTISEVA
jgi:hypothetical protein